MSITRALDLVPIGDDEVLRKLLSPLAERLESFLGIPVVITPPFHPDFLVGAASNSQVQSNHLVDALVDRAATGASAAYPYPDRWTLAITDLDLAAEGRAFVFGEATQDGSWAVLSTARLLPDVSQDAAFDRLMKVALHELGHLAGLDHCHAGGCVMSRAKTVEDVAAKGASFCGLCMTTFHAAIRP